MKMRELLSDESKWTKGTMARNESGIAISTTNGEACCFCLWGAMVWCYGLDLSEYSRVKKQIQVELGLDTIGQWNDQPERTFEEVQALVQKLDI
jgi:hypothetical protein